jgi:hypothetical protein
MKTRPPDDQDADVMSVDFDGRSIVFLEGDEMDTSEDMDYVNGVDDLGERLFRTRGNGREWTATRGDSILFYG